MIKFSIKTKRSNSAPGKASYAGIFALIVIMAAMFMPSAYAGANNFSGFLDGTEPTSSLSYGLCMQGADGSYDLLGPTTVSVSGTYSYTDISIGNGLDMQLAIYSPSFDDSNPTNNLVPLDDGYGGGNDVFDDFGDVDLTQGTTYYLVVQPLCNSQDRLPERWQFSLDGPGTFSGFATTIPTLSTIGLILASLLMALVAFAALRHRKLV